MAIYDVLQHIDLARILFGELIPLRRDARYHVVKAPPYWGMGLTEKRSEGNLT
jgi:hypothetical protein